VGAITQREKGSLLAFEEGVGNAFGIAAAQERGLLFIEPKDEVFKDMIIGVHQRPGDLAVNVCKTKAVRLLRLDCAVTSVTISIALVINQHYSINAEEGYLVLQITCYVLILSVLSSRTCERLAATTL